MDEGWLILFAAIGVLIIGIGVVIVMQLTWLGAMLREDRQEAARRHHRAQAGSQPEGAISPPVDLGMRKQEAKDQKKLFKEFINERPEILDEPKKIQFDEFRQWREARGL